MVPPEGTHVAVPRCDRTVDGAGCDPWDGANGDSPCPAPGWDFRPRPKRLPIPISRPAAGRSRHIVLAVTSAHYGSHCAISWFAARGFGGPHLDRPALRSVTRTPLPESAALARRGHRSLRAALATDRRGRGGRVRPDRAPTLTASPIPPRPPRRRCAASGAASPASAPVPTSSGCISGHRLNSPDDRAANRAIAASRGCSHLEAREVGVGGVRSVGKAVSPRSYDRDRGSRR